MYQSKSKAGNNECVKMMNIPEWVNIGSSVASHGKRMVIVEGWNDQWCSCKYLGTGSVRNVSSVLFLEREH